MSDASVLFILAVLSVMIVAAVGQLVITVIHVARGGRFDANGYLVPIQPKPSK